MEAGDSTLLRGEARVVAVEGDAIVVEAMPRAACGGCAQAGGCGVSVLSGLFGRRAGARITLANTCDAQAGDIVAIGIRQGPLLRAAVMAYALPVATLALGALLGLGLSGGDAGALAGSAAGFAAGLVVARRLARRREASMRPVLLGQGDAGACGAAR